MQQRFSHRVHRSVHVQLPAPARKQQSSHLLQQIVDPLGTGYPRNKNNASLCSRIQGPPLPTVPPGIKNQFHLPQSASLQALLQGPRFGKNTVQAVETGHHPPAPPGRQIVLQLLVKRPAHHIKHALFSPQGLHQRKNRQQVVTSVLIQREDDLVTAPHFGQQTQIVAPAGPLPGNGIEPFHPLNASPLKTRFKTGVLYPIAIVRWRKRSDKQDVSRRFTRGFSHIPFQFYPKHLWPRNGWLPCPSKPRPNAGLLPDCRANPRSEERRVGKECRSRWSPDHSSRRRHTRCGRDWSSDVCSSDLRHCKVAQKVRQTGCFPTLYERIFAYTFSILSKALVAEKWVATLPFKASAKRRASSGLSSKSTTAAARASGSEGGTRRPQRP